MTRGRAFALVFATLAVVAVAWRLASHGEESGKAVAPPQDVATEAGGETRAPVEVEAPAETGEPPPDEPSLRREVVAEARANQAASAAVAGRVLVDGSPPAEPLKLWLLTTGGTSRTALTKPGGAFRFDLGTADWSGRLGWGTDYYRTDVPREDRFYEATVLRLPAPREDVVLRLESAGWLVGRIVDPRDALPVARAEVGYRIPGKDGEWTRARLESADADGRFRLSMRRPFGPTRFEFGPHNANTLAALELPHPPAATSAREWDLGDVFLDATQSVRFAVTDADGQPLYGAVARALDAEGSQAGSDSSLTGPDGRGLVELPASTAAVRCVRVGFRSQSLPVPENREEVLLFELDATSTLELSIDLPSAARPKDYSARLAADAPFFVEGEGGSPEDFGELDKLWPALPESYSTRLRNDAGCAEAVFRFRGNGRLLLSGIRSGVAIDLELLDRYRTPLHVETLAPFAPGEARERHVVLNDRPLPVTGRVVDADGEPVPRASVRFGPGARVGAAVTDAEGRFAIDDAGGRRGQLAVLSRRHPPLAIADYEFPASGEVELRLPRGRTVRVTTVYGDGSPATLCRGVSFTPEGLHVARRSGRSLGGGVFELADVPEGQVTVYATAGQRMHAVELPQGADELTVAVEQPGTVVVELHLDALPEEAPGARLQLSTWDLDWPKWSRRLGDVRELDGEPLFFREVAPGSYELLWAGRGPDGVFVPLSEPLPVKVTPGGTVRVVL